jgi:antirestriction protein ArdC
MDAVAGFIEAGKREFGADLTETIQLTPEEKAELEDKKTKQDHRLSPEERAERLAKAFDEIETAVGKITTSDDWQRYLDFQGKFHNYSARNCLWLLAQAEQRKMELGQVASYRAWQKMGRNVNKGEHGYKVLAPIVYKHEKSAEEIEADRRNVGAIKSSTGLPADPDAPTERHVRGFRLETVFDVSQTSGEPLPTSPAIQRLEGECPPEIIDAIRAEIEGMGYEVKPTNGNLAGWSDSTNGRTLPGAKAVQIRDDLSPAQTAKTLTHELAHIVMEHTNSDVQAETEAESVAYITMKHFGIDSGDYSFGYVSSWAKDTAVVQRSAETIRKTATTLADRLEARMEQQIQQDVTADRHADMSVGPELEISF